MKVRVKFTKNDPVKYLGHLDIMRFFQKCFVRARVKMLYTEGFNPHQKMSFALPLGVGITSRAEYLDADIEDGQDLFKIRNDLDLASGCGFDILDVREVEEGAQSLMSVVRSASYEIKSADGSFYVPQELMEQSSIYVLKKTKKGSREIDIKPLIISLDADESLRLRLFAGSENNLNPELVLKAICRHKNVDYKREDYEIERTGLYGPDKTDLIEYQTCRVNQESL